MSTTVKDLLAQQQNPNIFHVPPNTSAAQVANIMRDLNISAIFVAEWSRDTAGLELLGLVSERDLAHMIADSDSGPAETSTPVSLIMTPRIRLITVSENDTLRRVVRDLEDNHIRHLPVLGENGLLQGMISVRDAMKAVVSALESALTAEQLEHQGLQEALTER